MVRRCAVENCRESDLSILAHRFPRDREIALRWKEALNLESMSLELLQEGSYVVCTKHFKESDYRNLNSNGLNSTAVPNLDDNKNERIQTTKGKRKSELTQIKCHKISSPTSTKKRNHPNQIKEVLIKKLKVSVAPIKKESLKIISNEVVKPVMIEACEEINEIITEDDHHNEMNDSELILESEEANFIQLFDKNIQTEEEIKIEPPKEVDKDDKIISLLYPKYSGLTKIELVKMLAEKDLKISSLEDKEKQLENALKSLI